MINPFELILHEMKELRESIHSLQQQIGLTNNFKAPFVGIEEAAALLGISKSTLYGYVSKRSITFYKRGKKLMFKPDELLAWQATGKVLNKEAYAKELRIGKRWPFQVHL